MVDGTSILFPFAAGAGRRIAARLRGRRPTFICVVASTDTALVPGISAAGASPELIPYTAAADAEVLAYGAARCIRGVPCNPAGPPGPAIIAREALELADIPRLVVSAGCHVLPDAPYVALGSEPGAHIGTGRAVPHARDLFDAGRALGRAQAAQSDYLVLAESVPGGTTTALALLLALGIAADGRVSSSLAGNPHALKS
ncbi:MAG TPA: TIGR00303 family protein, partial [Chloroflexota bacterium]|nr:TIGR00303 family protein [Chloroflexota bacterium]